MLRFSRIGAIVGISLLLAIGTGAQAITIDNFDDEIVDPAIWGSDTVSGPEGISFAEQGGRLDLLSTSSDLSQSRILRRSVIPLHNDGNWSISVEVHNLLDVHSDLSARVGLIVLAPNDTSYAGILLKVDDPARRLQAYIDTFPGFGPDLWPGPADALEDNGLLTIAYDAGLQELALMFTNGLGSGPPVSYLTVSTLDWDLGTNNNFEFGLLATTAGTTVGPNTAYFDNLAMVPEPRTWMLFCGGLLALGGIARLRRPDFRARLESTA